ncbi:hypothetical protein CcaverHIS002_0100040 [Cutaneotrichosporon cavernicola]|uniref:Alpha/beta-hydrolase n=1 Tax=Cutaneotrichosporon cavernicola TaxID=279322 RepID=A0AA48I0I7_9TREE|nr:uncharacterized protein CcaverHIS019_0100020 [Cutaneotrichosporon cavernicola]BEI79475.1 hypothetical protein CcaverHIS002_0100040 [Cutaneotrichosporon cavernicola]BEI87284.1 hypothetical protein CcaverHIS019_0100020 [Cutaneotrichosporon cavernicola]BEI95054.1 hypothetical protein CcaverHIS631_0100030 [Cutaneotrichosporon cavernicola]BEJ02828.1 hypothetical protein CcaverHIS641_0100030 [Cutaneotrichosporon cavernicola]
MALNFSACDLGAPHASRQVVKLVDLEVNVFGLDEIKGSKLPIVAIVVHHPFAGKARDVAPFASGLLAGISSLAATSRRQRTHDAIIVTLDARNHGDRRTNKEALRFGIDRKRDLTEMATLVSGGMHDFDLIRSFLPAFLFPGSERDVTDWAVCGISMGGHVTWRLLRHDKVQIAVNIVTVPSEGLGGWLMSRHGKKDAPEGDVIATLPAPVCEFYKSTAPVGTYSDKKILSLHAEKDAMLPASAGAAYFPGIQAQAARGDIEQWIQPRAKHKCTPQMTRRAAEWYWRWCLSSDVAKL